MNSKELNEILEKHVKWLNNEIGGERANLCGAKNIPFISMTCPDAGSFIGWKKALSNEVEHVIVKLEILKDAKRSSATTRKCRCDKAKVLAIETIKGEPIKYINARSEYDHSFIYKVGKIVSVDNFNEDRWNECAPGIHFFINRQEAVEY